MNFVSKHPHRAEGSERPPDYSKAEQDNFRNASFVKFSPVLVVLIKEERKRVDKEYVYNDTHNITQLKSQSTAT